MDFFQIERFRRHIRDNQSHERYRHSLSVGHALEQAAKIYGFNPVQGLAAGILHDLAKELPLDQMVELIKEGAPNMLGDIIHPVYLHGPAGAVLARKLGLRDDSVLNAIAQHAGTEPDMGLLSRCTFVADMTAPTQDFKGRSKLTKLFFSKRLDEAELLLCAWILEFVSKNKLPNHPGYEKRIHALSEIVRPGRGFFSREDDSV